tara:strand:- start:1309 stop:1512 length:204 start_codon:yes stop_codon:yes gene_type:complete
MLIECSIIFIIRRMTMDNSEKKAPNEGVKALREQARTNPNAQKALDRIGYKNGGCVMVKTNQKPHMS